MRIDEHLLENFVADLALTRRGYVGPASQKFMRWLKARNVPKQFIYFLSIYSPKKELWAGAGSLYSEEEIIERNNDYPSAVKVGLLLVGNAPNGDRIAIDFLDGDGATGYISHEHDWEVAPRTFFIPVISSIGAFVHHLNNDEEETLPVDYWEAKDRVEKSNEL